ncbi:E3 ubiquitin/ISG15 ligase TRIM25 [Leucoraja erinacea]|uniref:E3 ubiquitin/ISG15 ligase TRIM25 n=1 Tax=Leucoraja erinaceus TaxID=7782 RepID=UPI0024543319|nr:E3 ubiquitin/ISG15 ligase TRIM25 [Leucoraja erinacea]
MESAALPDLAAELTCAICLELLREPVTAPCGHNFCQDCLALYWAEQRGASAGFSCPQCRSFWAQRPELRPNRVLCAVVAGLGRALPGEGAGDGDGDGAGDGDTAVPCDACPPAAAAAATRTCLTCLASYCGPHLEPHVNSPALRSHSLCPPLPDLAQRCCPHHHKLLEFRCPQHALCLCAVCLLEHGTCSTRTEEEARGQRQEELKGEQKEMEFRLMQLQHSMERMQFQKEHVKDSSAKEKVEVAAALAEIRAMVEREEEAAAQLIEAEESRADSECVGALADMSGQLERIKEHRQRLNVVLAHTGGIAFWQRVEELPDFGPDATKDRPVEVEVDARRLQLISRAVTTVRSRLAQQLKWPLERRVKNLEEADQAGQKPRPPPQMPVPEVTETPGAGPDTETNSAGPRDPADTVSGSAPRGRSRKPKNKPENQPNIPPLIMPTFGPTDHLSLLCHPFLPMPAPKDKQGRPGEWGTRGWSPQSFATEAERQKKSSAPRTRQDFMHYNCKVTFNYRTAHKKLVVGDRYTSLCVGDKTQSGPEYAERFYNCCQVLGLQWFTNGRRYWQVGVQGPSFWAVGVAAAGMDRSGSSSRLGRNGLSWCVESFGQKLSAWHDNIQVPLQVPQPQAVGVYLDFEAGEVAFYSVGAAMLLLAHYNGPLRGQLHPACWLCSSGTKLILGDRTLLSPGTTQSPPPARDHHDPGLFALRYSSLFL